MPDSELEFEVVTPIGFRVRTTVSYWKLITTVKHPVMKGRQTQVQRAIAEPDEIRRSQSDDQVYLFYRKQREERWICAVVKRLNAEGFLITTYPTDSIKEGERVWPR